MHYWNQRNFKSIKSIGESYKSKSGYEGFADYCLLREKGLKKQALAALDVFLRSSKLMPITSQRELACELTELYFYNSDAHQLLAHPLSLYLSDVFKSWCSESPASAIPYRWAAIMTGNYEYFDEALIIDPEDQISLYRLAWQALHELDHQTHHLSESQFLGLESDAVKALATAASFAVRLAPGEAKNAVSKEVAYYRGLLSAWDEYRIEPRALSFMQWSAQRGYNFEFPAVVYYDQSET